MAIITSFSRGHGMGSWCCLIDVECRFSPSENLHLLVVGELESNYQVGCSKDQLFTLCIFIFSPAQTHSSGSELVLFQVPSSIKTS